MSSASCSSCSAVSQVIPYELDQDPASASHHFQQDYSELISLLRQSYDGLLLQIFPPEIHNPYPIGVTLSSFYTMKRVTQSLSRALSAVVQHYFQDPRLCDSLLEVSAEAKKLLRLVEKRPYAIGSWRPDILYPKENPDHFQVCEINARFPFNGFYASHEKNNILGQLSYLKGTPLMPVNELDGIPDAFCAIFDSHKSVGVLKFDHGKEGWDVKMHIKNSKKECTRDLPDRASVHPKDSNCSTDMEMEMDMSSDMDAVSPPCMHRSQSKSFPDPQLTPKAISETLSLPLHEEEGQEKGGSRKRSLSLEKEGSASVRSAYSAKGARFVHPDELYVSFAEPNDGSDSGSQNVLSDTIGPLEQFVLECSTTELLSMDPRLLARITSCSHFNDLRTIFLAHDKRMLAALSCPEILRQYVSPEDAAVLRRHLVPTFIVGVHTKEVAEAKLHRHEWVMKPNSGGKGVGIVFGRDCPAIEWSALLEDPSHRCYVLQRIVSQQLVDIATATGTKEMLVVGLLHCFNENFLGPGIFRASSLDHPIVNVSGGNGVILSPAVLSCRWNLTRRPPNTPSNTTNVLFNLPDHMVFSLQEKKKEDFEGSESGHGDGGNDLFAKVWAVLQREGIAVIHTPWADRTKQHNKRYEQQSSCLPQQSTVNNASDNNSLECELDLDSALLQIVRKLHCSPHMHSQTAGSVWDVKPVHDTVNTPSSLTETMAKIEADTRTKDSENKAIGSKQQPLHPRSKTAEAFRMHTDCSFESPPPRYILLYVVREDRQGGGLTTLVDTEVLLRLLTRQSLFTLMNSRFHLRVPAEFHKGGADTLCTPLISSTEKRFQYRSDIVLRDKCTPAQLAALQELDALLASPALQLTTRVPAGALLLLDNTRWFHGRTAILDKQRWLKRIRFNATSSPSWDMRKQQQQLEENKESEEDVWEILAPPLQRLVTRTHSLQQERELQESRACNISDPLFAELDRQSQMTQQSSQAEEHRSGNEAAIPGELPM